MTRLSFYILGKCTAGSSLARSLVEFVVVRSPASRYSRSCTTSRIVRERGM